MSKFNLSKKAAKNDLKNYNTMLEEQTKEKRLTAEVPSKNVNLSMPIKDKDNTITIEGQIDRKDGKDPAVVEKELETGKKVYNDKRDDSWNTSVMPINQASEEYDQEKTKALKAAENEKRDTAFWDKYVGVQMEGDKTTVSKNVPEIGSQLQNNPARFKGKKIDKMVSASLKDADAMLFHIYATSAQEGRNLTKIEEQQIVDINSGKVRILTALTPQTLEEPQLGRPQKNVDQIQRRVPDDLLSLEPEVPEAEVISPEVPGEEFAEPEIPVESPFEQSYPQEDAVEEPELDLQVGTDGRTIEVMYGGTLIDTFDEKKDVNENLKDATQNYFSL